jgi:TM2 domain-containing membrane protein YozV
MSETTPDPSTPPGWTSTESTGGSTETSTQAETSTREAFCQDCGTTLTSATARRVGAAVFCEPCLSARIGPTSTAVPPPQPVAPDEASPALAAILGFIPGVGAMYNGQFAKGVVHLIIFAVIVSLCNINGIFGLFIAGWIFYMVFEAYHTAVARRDGLPLPNAFGFNDIGERMGFPRTWPAAAPRSTAPTQQQPTPPQPQQPPYTPTAGPAYTPVSQVPVNQVPVGTAPDWVGYVPPSVFATPPPAPDYAAPMADTMAANIRAQAMRDAGYQPPYAETYTGTSYATSSTSALPLDPAARRFPVGAIWLIGLGVLILLANLLPDWQISERWWPPVLLAGLAVWTFTRRLGSGVRTVCILRWPIILMLLAVLQALHAVGFNVTSALAVAVLLIVFGVLLLLERTLGASPAYPVMAAYTAGSAGFNAQVAGSPSRTSWAASGAPAAQPEASTTTPPSAEDSLR